MVVTGSPSTLELVADRIFNANFKIEAQPALVVLSGEPVSTEVRRKIIYALSCAVTSVYAMGEVGILGTECPEGGYHTEPNVAVIEVLDERGNSVRVGDIGELTVTTLHNRAMPLVRYRTGDRVGQLPPCGCQDRGLRVRLASVRPAQWLVTDGGAAVHTVRFAKLWRTLQVSGARLHQAPDGSVEAQYWAPDPLTEGQQAVVIGSLRSALGRQKTITATWTSGMRQRVRPDTPAAPEPSTRPEPLPDAPGDVAGCLREALAPASNEIDAVLITGSYLDFTGGTRFSDIDVTVLTSAPVQVPSWTNRIRDLRAQLPRLRINVEHPVGLVTRSPLIVARMQQERLLVLGQMPIALSGWPDHEALRRDALTWAWQSLPLLWHQLSAPQTELEDPVYTAYLAQKFIVDACRYHHLLTGGRTTRALRVIAAELAALAGPTLSTDGHEAFEVARELRPPPPDGGDACERYLTVASVVLRALSSALDGGSGGFANQQSRP
ncbi:hypothetical protein ABZU25_17090 [Micromonospora sp. NPDC005215]|uniref:hypothetical protein n=1 Tax=Micromonospora sp. NPDC005215 TaxID=3157024 RepID=UPI00339F3330